MTDVHEAVVAAGDGRGDIGERAGSRRSLDSLPALISVPVAADILGLTRATAYRYAAAGGLPVRRFGGRRVYVVTASLRALIETGGEAA